MKKIFAGAVLPNKAPSKSQQPGHLFAGRFRKQVNANSQKPGHLFAGRFRKQVNAISQKPGSAYEPKHYNVDKAVLLRQAPPRTVRAC